MYEVPRIVEFIESESTSIDARGQGVGEGGWGRGKGELVLKGTEFQFRKVKNSGYG